MAGEVRVSSLFLVAKYPHDMYLSHPKLSSAWKCEAMFLEKGI
jgi:hypothetical protein